MIIKRVATIMNERFNIIELARYTWLEECSNGVTIKHTNPAQGFIISYEVFIKPNWFGRKCPIKVNSDDSRKGLESKITKWLQPN